MSENPVEKIKDEVKKYLDNVEDEFNISTAVNDLEEIALEIAGKDIESYFINGTIEILRNEIQTESSNKSRQGNKFIGNCSNLSFKDSNYELEKYFISLGKSDYLPLKNAMPADLEIVRQKSNNNFKKVAIANEKTNSGIDRIQPIMSKENCNFGQACKILGIVD